MEKMEKPKLRIIELCSGIGAQYRGLQNTGLFDVEVVATSEIDKDAVVSYAAVHCGLTQEMIDNYPNYPTLDEMREYLKRINLGYVPEKDKPYAWDKAGKKFECNIKKYWLACQLNKNLGDVTRIDVLPKADVWFLSFPCQSISVAGKLRGMDPDSGTRSSLVWQTIRLLQAAKETNTLPKYMMLENVKNLVGKKFIKDFDAFNSLIEEFGYSVHWKVINAKDAGIPQNRERVFAVYILKDIDTGNLTWPIPFDNGLRLKDVLDEDVDENYFINTPKAQELIQKLIDDGVLGDDVQKQSVNPMEDGTGRTIKNQYYKTSLANFEKEGTWGASGAINVIRERENVPIDLSIKKPRSIEFANCVSARTDRGISNHQAEGSGVCQLS